MTITKEKKASPKGMKLPSKTYINLAQKESKKRDVVTSILGLILIVILAGCVAKFGVIDQFARQNRAEAMFVARRLVGGRVVGGGEHGCFLPRFGSETSRV